MASNSAPKKPVLPSIRGMLKKKAGPDHNEIHSHSLDSPDGMNSPIERQTSSKSPLPAGVFKSHSSSSIPSTLRRTVAQAMSHPDGGSEPNIVMDQGMVLALTQDVRRFSDGLATLHNVIYKRDESGVGESLRVSTHEKLGDVLSILKAILKQYPAVNSTDLLTATGVLIARIKGFDYHDVESDQTELYEGIDQLALSFSSSVSEYLMGDIDTSFGPGHMSSQPLESPRHSSESRIEHQRELLSAEKMDSQLAQMDSGVDLALERAKAWSKYAKDVITYIEKRTALEQDFARGLSKLTLQMKPAIMENSFLPFQSVFCLALDQDKDFATTSQASCTLMSQKFIDPLTERRHEHEKARKLLREEWSREVKKMNEAITNLKKAKLMYNQRCIEFEKTEEIKSKMETDALNNSAGLTVIKQLEKKRKLTEEAQYKAHEAENVYKTCVAEANTRQTELEKTKGIILSQVRELITLCERTMKAATIAYFQLQHTVSAPAPVQFQTLCENCKSYQPGMQYCEFIRGLPMDDTVPHEQFSFEPHVSDGADKSRKVSGNTLDSSSPSTFKSSTPNFESESLSSGGQKSSDNSPSGSPLSSKKHNNSDTASYSKDRDSLGQTESLKSIQNERVAGHLFKKLRTPAKCRVCDSYVYFNGSECEQCGVACHKKCLATLTQTCGSLPTARRMTTFGVSFDDHIQSQKVDVPVIVTKCIQEIDRRGRDIKGMYRVSGVKSKVEKLCQSFEQGGEIDLSEHHPNVISNVLKLYLRQLPEPLMTVALYSEFVGTAREQSNNEITDAEAVTRLKGIIDKLPLANYKTAATIIHHLKRVTALKEENQMNASNLGIVFGPTLLRSSEGPVNLNSLIDTAHQTRAIELLIEYSTELFGVDPVKLSLEKQPIAEEEDGDADSLSSLDDGSDYNRVTSVDNLTDEIFTTLNKNTHHHEQPSLQDSDEHLDSVEDLNSSRTQSKHYSELTANYYHSNVVRSASMPFTSEKLSTFETKTTPRMGIKMTVESLNDGESRRPTNIRTNANVKPQTSYQLTGQNMFYNPTSGTTPQSSLLPSVRSGRRMSADSVTPFTTSKHLGVPELSGPQGSTSLIGSPGLVRSSGKPGVFSTHSMKKKSTEPQFV